jgi:hypothetical protein
MATLGVTFTGAALSMGGKKAEDASTPPINAKSPDEENFVKCVHDILHNPRNSPSYSVWMLRIACNGVEPGTWLIVCYRDYVKKAAEKVQGKQ